MVTKQLRNQAIVSCEHINCTSLVFNASFGNGKGKRWVETKQRYFTS